MSDENTPAGTPAPAAPVTPPAATAPRVMTSEIPDEVLKEKLVKTEEKARAKLLAELGIDDPEKAKAAIALAKKAETEAKSVSDRLAETSTQLGKAQTEAERYKAVTTEFAARQMMALSAEQQAAVKAIAGEDAAAQLGAITALTPTWAKSTPATPAPVTPAAGTAPPPNAPASSVVSHTDHKAVYATLQKSNPFEAARYGIEHAREVFPESAQ